MVSLPENRSSIKYVRSERGGTRSPKANMPFYMKVPDFSRFEKRVFFSITGACTYINENERNHCSIGISVYEVKLVISGLYIYTKEVKNKCSYFYF